MRRLAVALFAAALLGESAMPAKLGATQPDHHGVCAVAKPGSDLARWQMKTTLQPAADVGNPRDIKIADFIQAPHLQLAGKDIATLRTLSKQHQRKLFEAKARWVVVPRTHDPNNFDFLNEAQALHQVSAPFNIRLRAPTIDMMSAVSMEAREDSASVSVRHPNVNDVVSAAIGDGPITQAVPIGGNMFHEGEIVSVTATVLDFGCEPDGDHHMSLGDNRDDPKYGCIIVEIPNPSVIKNAKLRSAVSRADGDSVTVVAKDQQVTVTGQLFYDAHHAPNSRGKNRCATTLWEVHPIIALQ